MRNAVLFFHHSFQAHSNLIQKVRVGFLGKVMEVFETVSSVTRKSNDFLLY